jgi:hypothetical protein
VGRLGMPGKPELEFHVPAGRWYRPQGAVAGVWEQVLAAGPGGDATVLQRYDPGVDTGPNGVLTHPYWEEVYLLDGELTDVTLGADFGRGAYACRPPGMPHGPYRSHTGVLMLVITRFP